MEQIEKAARALAVAHQCDPDAMAFAGQPYFLPRSLGFVAPRQSVAAWQLFAFDADVVIRALADE